MCVDIKQVIHKIAQLKLHFIKILNGEELSVHDRTISNNLNISLSTPRKNRLQKGVFVER